MNCSIETGCMNCSSCESDTININADNPITNATFNHFLSTTPINIRPAITVRSKKLTNTAKVPAYQTTGAGAADVYADLPDENILVNPGEAVLVSTGMSFEVPEDHVMLVFSRSGHGIKNRINLANCVGVIDSDYRGELKIAVANNHRTHSFPVNDKDRIAQILTVYAPQMNFVEVDELSDTDRGAGGFGSTNTAG